MHVIAAKAVCFKEAMEEDFKTYQQQILSNAKKMSERFMANDIDIVSNGTSNHMFLVNLIKNEVTGKNWKLPWRSFITVNKNSVPNDPKSPFVTSGIRVELLLSLEEVLGKMKFHRLLIGSHRSSKT